MATSQSDSSNSQPVCLDDVERIARQKLDKNTIAYYATGSDECVTLRDNIEAFKRWRLRPRLLRGISDVDLSTTVLGQTVSMPICVAPTGFQKMAHPDGEKATARACAKSQTLMVLSQLSQTKMEDVQNAASTGLKWQQFSAVKDKENTKRLIHQAGEAGFKAIVLTIDNAAKGNRKEGFLEYFRGAQTPILKNDPAQDTSFDVQSLEKEIATWDIIQRIKSFTKLPVVIKGILTAEDARLAVQHGADAIVVSNHGGRQLDGVLATIDALPEVISAVDGQVEVYMDGGVRLGTDVLKALALGARAVFIGRPVIWGLAYQGEEGLYKVLEMLRKELRTAMILSGCSSVSDIPASLVTRQCQCHL